MTDNNEPNVPAVPAKPLVLYTSIMQHAAAKALMESAAVLLTKAEKFNAVPSDTDAELMGEFRARLNKTINDLDAERLVSTEDHRALVKKLNDEANAKLNPMRAVLTRVDELLKQYREKKEADRLAALKAKTDEEARVAREKADAEAKAREANEAAQKAAADIAAAQQMATLAGTPEDKEAAQKLLEEAQATQRAAIDTAAQSAAQAVQLEQRQDVLASMPVPGSDFGTIRGTYGSSSSQRANWVWELIDTPEQPASESVKLVPEEYLVEPAARLAKSVLNAKAKAVGKALPKGTKETTTAVPGLRIYNDPIESSRVGR